MRPRTLSVFESYHPNEYQKKFHAVPAYSNRMVKGFIGALGAGKSTACENEQIELCMKMPNGLSVATRKSHKRATFSLVDDYKKILHGVAKWRGGDEYFEFPNGHKLIVAPADSWERFGSWEICSYFIQEAHEVDGKIFSALNSRLRSPEGKIDGKPYYRGYVDARGITSSHWLNTEFIQKAWHYDLGPAARATAENPDFVYFRGRTEQNRQNLPDGYIEGLRRDHKGDINWIKIFLEGEVGHDVEGKAVFGDSWDSDRHIRDISEDPSLPILRSTDFGYRAPSMAWYQYTRSGRLLKLRELCPENVSTDELLQMAQSLQSREWKDRPRHTYRDYGDIAGEQLTASSSLTDVEKLEDFFQTSMESRKARIEDGLNVIRKLMRDSVKVGGKLESRFAVDSSCITSIEAYSGAYYYPNGPGQLDRVPKKGNGYDRCFVWNTPVRTREGWVSIKYVRVGDEVLTRKGYRRVTASGVTAEEAETVHLVMDTGNVLTGTPAHPIFVDGEWRPLISLRYGDKLLSWQEIESSTEAGPTTTSHAAATTTPGSGSIGKNGPTPMAQFQRATTSTIATATRTTTTSRIWNVFPLPSITLDILGSSLRTFAQQLRSGTLPLPVGPSIGSTARTHGREGRSSISPVSTAGSRFAQSWLGRNGVLTLARRLRDWLVGWMTSAERAEIAESPSGPTSIRIPAPVVPRVLHVLAGKKEAVYNLTVEGEPEFFASGVLVHNCADVDRYVAQLVVEEGYAPEAEMVYNGTRVAAPKYFGSYNH